ncbi:energy transducer TonB [Variovorax sp. J2P1-59]|uniref:energy transducer TonB n=1 Tax=Variovorax flavidus TaxID=3053501 RepID=UPI0025761345|nr:energy transducer TonB [Variovorax sp. J2P1-59]MDM0078636.1 energy transducer TonB [Variovorax sp. J2P1-59]
MITQLRSFSAVLAVAAILSACNTPSREQSAQAAGSEPFVSASPKAEPSKNQKPVYPATAKRLGQQGKTIVRVLVDVEGRPSQARVMQSSGYQELDQAAVDAVSGWKYVPGRRKGVPEPMEFNIPVTWSLN